MARRTRAELNTEYIVGRVTSGSRSRDPAPESLKVPRSAGIGSETVRVKMVDASGNPAGRQGPENTGEPDARLDWFAMVSRKNSDPPDKADDRDILDVLDQDVLNVVFGSRGDHGIVASMAKSVGIGKVVKYRDRWRIDLGRAIEHTAGARYIYSMGPGAPFKKKAVAEAVLFRLRADIAKGGRTPEDVVLDYLPDGKQNLVLARMEKWLENLRRKERAGDRSDNYLRDIERWLKPEGYFRWWQGRSIHAVDEATAEDFADWLAEQLVPRGKTKGKPLSAKTRRNILGAFRAFYRWAGRRDRRVRELRYFPWPEANEPDIQVITIAERDAIIAAIPEPKRGVYLALKLGAPRPNMAIEILTSDYDRKSRMLTLARARKGRTVDSQVGSTKTRVAWTIQANEGWPIGSRSTFPRRRSCKGVSSSRIPMLGIRGKHGARRECEPSGTGRARR
jgi:hypothetical protein